MIHPDAAQDADLQQEAQIAFLAAHPHRHPWHLNNDLAAIEWRHGYITGRRSRLARTSDTPRPPVPAHDRE